MSASRQKIHLPASDANPRAPMTEETEAKGKATKPNVSNGPIPSILATGSADLRVTAADECPAVLTLDDTGMIRDCNRAGEALFKYRRSELVWRHVSILLPQLADMKLMQDGQPNPRLRFLCRVGRRFQAVTHDMEHFASELFFNVLEKAGRKQLLLIVRPAELAMIGTSAPSERTKDFT